MPRGRIRSPTLNPRSAIQPKPKWAIQAQRPWRARPRRAPLAVATGRW